MINQSIDDPQAAQDLINGAKKQDPTNRDIMTAILAAIHSLQTQVINLAEKQASTTSTVSFLGDETNRIRLGVAKLQQEAGRIQKGPAPALRPAKPQPQLYQQEYAPPPPATLLPGAANLEGTGHITNQTLAQYAQEQQQPPQRPIRKTPAPSSAPRIQADDWAEVTNKGNEKAKTFAQAAVAAAASPSQQQAPVPPPAWAKTYPREESDLIIATSSHTHLTPTLPKLHGITTAELTKCNNRLALPIGVRLRKKGSIVVTTTPRAPASSIKANIEALLSQISALSGTTCRTTSERQAGISFLIHAVPTFERGITKTPEQHEAECLENLGRQIAPNTTAPPTNVKFLRNRQHRESSKSKGSFVAIVVTFETEPTFTIPGRIPAETTIWRIYNRSCKTERMHPNHKNSVCKNCLEFGHPTDVCMASNKILKYGYCGGTHNHFNHECTTPGCNEKTAYRHTVLNFNLCGTTGDHHSLNRNCPTFKARNAPRASQGTLPQDNQNMQE